MPAGRKLRVVVADDHAVVREGLTALVNAEPDMEVVGHARDGIEACAQIAKLRPHVAVVDVSMPGAGGVEVARAARAIEGVRVLALTVHEERAYVLALIEAGAAGYVLKRTAAADLIRAIRAVARGEMYVDPAMTAALLDRRPSRDQAAGASAGGLSEREADTLRLVAKGYSNKEIAVQFGVSVKTVETHKARSMEKLGLRTRAEIVRFAIDQGWLVAEG